MGLKKAAGRCWYPVAGRVAATMPDNTPLLAARPSSQHDEGPPTARSAPGQTLGPEARCGGPHSSGPSLAQRRRLTTTPRTASRPLTAALKSVPSESLFDGSGKRLGDVCAAPGERRPRVDAEASEDVGETTWPRGRRARPVRQCGRAAPDAREGQAPEGRPQLGAQRKRQQRPFSPGKPSCGRLHCSSAATARASRDGSLGRTTRREGSRACSCPNGGRCVT